jgi:Protein of unknown function (DUF1566)
MDGSTAVSAERKKPMPQNMPKLGAVLMTAVIAAWVGAWGTPAFAADAQVVVTGQTQCWDASGTSIPCDGTGQDGDIQAGLPYPTPRFKDNGDGTVEDKLTDLIWLKNANCSTISPAVWATALSNANSLVDGQCDLSDGSMAGDWRLPNVKELQSLIDFGNISPALPTGHPFLNVQSADYWSSTTRAGNPVLAWVVDLGDGNTIDVFKDNTTHVWPVRGGIE